MVLIFIPGINVLQNGKDTENIKYLTFYFYNTLGNFGIKFQKYFMRIHILSLILHVSALWPH